MFQGLPSMIVSGGSPVVTPPPPSGVVLVQIATNTSGGVSGNSIPATFSSTPTVGNVMFAAVSWAAFGGAAVLTNPSGWTVYADSASGNAAVRVLYRVVQSGDGVTYTWSNNFSDRWSLKLYEFSGASTSSQGDGSNTATVGGGAPWSLNSGNVTGTVTGDMPLSVFGADDTNALGGSTASSGWTIDTTLGGDYHQSLHASHTLTVDTSTPMAITWEGTTSAGTGASIIWLVKAA